MIDIFSLGSISLSKTIQKTWGKICSSSDRPIFHCFIIKSFAQRVALLRFSTVKWLWKLGYDSYVHIYFGLDCFATDSVIFHAIVNYIFFFTWLSTWYENGNCKCMGIIQMTRNEKKNIIQTEKKKIKTIFFSSIYFLQLRRIQMKHVNWLR